MMLTATDGDRRIEFFVRTELPKPAEDQSALLGRRLERLDDRDVAVDVTRREWPERVPVGDCDGWIRDTYLAFTDWADRNGTELTPFFSTRECYTPDRETYTDWLVLPAFCLAVYEDGELNTVYPHKDGTETRTVEDAIDALERELVETSEQTLTVAD